MIESIKINTTKYIKETENTRNVALAIKGDKAAYSRLIIKLEKKLYRISRSVLKNDADCADAIQEALIRAWLKLPTLRDPNKFEHWLARILLRECYRIVKKAKYYSEEEERYAYINPDNSQKLMIQEAVYKLKVEQRTPIILHHMMGYKVCEIARILGIPQGTVKSRLMRGRTNLKMIMKEESL